MRFLIPVIGFVLSLSPVEAAATPHKAAHHSMHTAKMKTACKGAFMYSKGGKCIDARDKSTK
jgi:hypothetical protein